MKRFIASIIALVILCATVSAEVPAFLTEIYNNYTANYSFTMTFEAGDEIVALLDETDALETVSRYVDIKALLESIFSSGSSMTVQADISEDFKKAEIALTSDSKSNVVVNKNLNISIDSKMGMWLKADIGASEPVFEIIYLTPGLNKYMVLDLFSLADSEDEKVVILEILNRVLNKEYIESISSLSTELLEKYAKIKMSGAMCTVQIDNAGLIGIIKELFPVIFKMAENMAGLNEAASIGIIGGADGPTAIYVGEEETDYPDIDNIQILGKDGIIYKYSLFSGKISKAEIKADISFDISKFMKAVSGEEWPYQTKGVLDFLLKSDIKMTKIGQTKVNFPVLTEENSFSFKDTLPQYDMGEYIQEYPYSFIWVETNELPVLDGEYYVPLRETLENAYGDTVTIEYNKGVLNISSEQFEGFKNLKLEVNSEDAYIDGALRKIPKVIVSNGKTYAGTSVFENIFGWELNDITHYILSGYFEICFYTI